MIVTFLLQLVIFFVNGVVSALPTIDFPQTIIDSFNTAIDLINTMNLILPTDTMFQVLGVYLSLHLSILGWRFVHWAYAWFRGHRILA